MTTDPGGKHGDPAWSPDGKHIAFASDQFGSENIYAINTDGTNQLPVTKDSHYYDGSPSCSPDGQYTVLSSSRLQGNLNIVRFDGLNLTRLTYDLGSDSSPAWSPVP